jgi:DNA-binding CsgD family transcriptional regulator
MLGELYLSAKIQHQILHQAAEALDSSQEQLVERLTRREREIFDLIGAGKTPSQIARQLGLSIKTVDTHRLHMKEKLFCETTADVAKFATIWRMYAEEGRPSEDVLTS